VGSKYITPLILNFVNKSKWVFYLTRPPPSGGGGGRKACTGQLKCDGIHAETRFRFSAKRTSAFKSAVASVQSTTGSRGVRISGIDAGYTKFRRSVKSTGYPLHPLVSPSLPLPCVTVCHHISTGLYLVGGPQSRPEHFGIGKNSCYDGISCHLP